MAIWRSVSRSLGLLSRRDRRVLVLIAVAQALLAFLDLAAILLMGFITSQALVGDGSEEVSQLSILGRSLSISIERNALLPLAALAGLLLVGKSLLNLYASRRIYSFIANRQAIVAARLSERVLHQPLLEIQRRASQETAYALGGGVLAATVGTLGAATVILAELTLTGVIVAGLLLVDPIVATFTIVFFGILAGVLQLSLGRWAFALGRRGSEAEIGSTSTLQHALRAYREVAVSGRRQLFIDRFSNLRWDAARVQADYFVLSQVSKYTFEIGLVVGGGLLVAVVSTTRDLATSLTTLTVFMLAAARIFPSILRTQGMANTVRNSEGLADTTFQLIADLDEADEKWGARQKPALVVDSFTRLAREGYPGFAPLVQVERVKLRYPGATVMALDDVNVTVGIGQSLAVVGPTGSGKSSLTDVMLGVIDPDQGSVSISGLKPQDAIMRWPGAMAYVPQDVAVLTGTIRENVALGIPMTDIDDDLVWECLDRAHLADFLRASSRSIDTAVGEHGMKLSGGQRQRLGIARALYTRPKFIVLDEATSALDAETEANIGETLRELAGVVTTVVVAHRLATVRSCDQVLYIHQGKMLGLGSFDEVRNQVPAFDRQAQLLGL